MLGIAAGLHDRARVDGRAADARLFAMVRMQCEDHVSALKAVGRNNENLPPSASVFEAGVGYDVDEETERNKVAAVADAMASKRQTTIGAAHERAAVSVLAGNARMFQDDTGTVWLSREGPLFNVSGKTGVFCGGRRRKATTWRELPPTTCLKTC